MRTVIDLTDEDRGDPHRAGLPDPAVVMDDGDVVLCFGPVELRLTYGQFDRIRTSLNDWVEALPAEHQRDL